MQVINAGTRVVVVDRRTLVREAIAAALRTAADLTVAVAGVSSHAELAAVDRSFDVVVTSLAPAETTGHAGVSVVEYRDTHTVEEIVDTLSGGAPLRPPIPESLPSSGRLTPREAQVLRGIAGGLSSNEIAAGLGIGPRTVDNHKQRIYAKLEVNGRAHAVAVCLASGLLPRSSAGDPLTVGAVGLPTSR